MLVVVIVVLVFAGEPSEPLEECSESKQPMEVRQMGARLRLQRK